MILIFKRALVNDMLIVKARFTTDEVWPGYVLETSVQVDHGMGGIGPGLQSPLGFVLPFANWPQFKFTGPPDLRWTEVLLADGSKSWEPVHQVGAQVLGDEGVWRPREWLWVDAVFLDPPNPLLGAGVWRYWITTIDGPNQCFDVEVP